MAKTGLNRLSPNEPLVREYTISDTRDVKNGLTICKYIKGRNSGTKEDPKWVDEVFEEWVENPSQIDLKWMKIRVTKELAV